MADVDMRYQFFCPAGTPYYDVVRADDDTLFATDLPAEWSTTVNDEWTVRTLHTEELPEQGWKVHVSATPDNAERVLAAVARYCADRRIAFKHLRGPRALFFRNSKYGDRGASGKFITVFPRDVGELRAVLLELGEILDGEPGPYVLSDLRWRQGPLYVRYGGFTYLAGPGPNGTTVPCLRRPDGTLEPDVRKPGFHVPEWVELPELLEEALAARNAGTLEDFPFRPEAALHFSNGGGVYRAVDRRDGARVLLKEARPMAGLDESGADAVTRLERERWAMETLAGVAGIPRLIDYRRGHEHYFLAREFVDGVTLSQAMHERNPLLTAGGLTQAGYTSWVLGVLDQVEEALQAMHARGVVFGDLHPNNIMITEDDLVYFIDLETAGSDTTGFEQRIGAPGFRAPAGVRGTDVDRYALGCTRLAVFLPATVVLPWQEGKREDLLEQVREVAAVPQPFLDKARAELALGAGTCAHPGPGVRLRELGPDERRRRLVAGVLAAATPERTDRLFPGDIGQFTAESGGVTFAHGAAGVLWGLHQLGVGVDPAHVDWLLAAVDRTRGLGPGLARGLAGVVYALDGMGRHDDAAEVVEHLLRIPTDALGPGLADGVGGLGLVLLEHHQRGGDPGLLDRAVDLADTLDAAAVPATNGREPTGWWDGWSGTALLRLRLHEATGEERHLVAARDAVRRDLGALGWGGESGQWRRHPSLARGAGGIALVLGQMRAVMAEEWVGRTERELVRACADAYLPQAGWLHGRAGVLTVLGQAGRREDDAAVQRHLRALDVCAVGDDDHVSVLGQELLRLSTDLATGSVGVALGLESIARAEAVGVPFVGGCAVRPAGVLAQA
ncbi:class III lanthionine synthetase LanKC [Georgenia faecalis]|uniref:non-specific serine/threonine protein kinase n=1 Tax=Georgenia faecalis TaxID=2483799 RepID=A0ABV9DBK4_9MICO|nr:class III lanthionine synthetase LanKC [Georgenia faecalis]